MKKWSHRKRNVLVSLFVFTILLGIVLFCIVASRANIQTRPGMVSLTYLIGIGLCVYYHFFAMVWRKHEPSSRRPLPLYATVRVSPYGTFTQQLFQRAASRGFSAPQTVALSEQSNTSFAYLTDEDGTYLLQTVWMPDFDESLVDAASDAVWNSTAETLGDCLSAGNITLLQLVCVQRMNSPFRTFAARKVYQQERRYHIVCPLSFGGKKAYRRPAKGTFLDPHYKQAEALVEELTDDLFDFPEKKKK